MAAPELMDDEDEQEYIGEDALTPEEMRARIAELEAQLAVKTAPVEMVTIDVPYDATGSIVKVNGEKFLGRVTISRAQAQTILNALGAKQEIERERLMPRGNLLSGDDLAAADAASRIIARRPRREVV